MTRVYLASSIAVLATAAVVQVASAQDSSSHKGGTQLSEAQCTLMWNKANPSGGGTIDKSQAQPYVTDFKAADPDSDGTLSYTEFQKACNQGLVQSSASSGAAGGESGAQETHNRETLHAPTNRVGKEVPTMRSEQNRPE